MLVPGTGLLTPEFCEKNPKKGYDTNSVSIRLTKGKGKQRKETKETITFKTRKGRLVLQHINMCKEAYDYMLETPVRNFAKKWRSLSVNEKIKAHLDIIAHDLNAVSYNYEILND